MRAEDLLISAWGDVPEPDVSQIDIPGWLVEGSDSWETIEIGGLDRDPESPHAPLTDSDIEKILDATGGQTGSGPLSNGGIDALAFYLPYAFYGKKWGIYINKSACLNEAARLHRNLLTFRRPSFDECVNAINEFVLRHELGHFAVERAGAAVMLASGAPRYKTSFSARRGDEEPLCTLREMRPLGQRVSKDLKFRADALHYWQSAALPFPYDLWPSMRPDGRAGYEGVAKHLFGTVGGASTIRDLMKVERRDEVPIRTVPLPVGALKSLGGLAPRINRLSVNAMLDHAKRCERLDDPPGILVTQGKRHSYTVKRKGKRSVDLDTVKWSMADYRVVKEMADFFDMSADEYEEMVRSKKGTTPANPS